ncbi:CDP-glycerol glycerophosphotransferase family protein [Patescibacteria group bacterium]|nr:CDP-glycerol glycerophosphotransferase family protein [Patescibacteria group bacterium]
MEKTIFIPIFQGVEARNVLRTDILEILKKQAELRIILFVLNKQKEEYFRKEFLGSNIHFEVFDHYKKPTLNNFFTFLKFILVRTNSRDAFRKRELAENKNYLMYFLKFIINRIFARKLIRKIVRGLDWLLVKDDNFSEYFDKYNPDLVLLAHLFGDAETSMLRQAKKRGIRSVGLINSWDKITTRCMMRLLPDKAIVHNNIVKAEAIKYVDIPPKDIEVVGIPHYDIYVTNKPTPRENFFKDIKVNPDKRILLVCPLGKTYSDVDIEMIDAIVEFQLKGLLLDDIQIIVRFPPNDIIDTGKINNKDKLILIQPGVRLSSDKERRVDWDMNNNDIQYLLDTLHYMSLIVCHASTLAIDSSVFDKPIINYCLKPKGKILPFRDARWIYGLNHYQSILNSGGVRVVKSKEELLEWINRYLGNSQIDRQGRKRIVEEQCWKLDGKAGERAANFLLKILDNS